MIKVKDGYAKLIGTTYLGSASRVLLSNGGDHVLGNASGNIPLSNGTVNTNLNADLLDGLHIHTGRNNEANKIVRTDANGYIQAGWINTTSGNFTGTPNKIYASNDDYIRYMTPANFFPTLTNTSNLLDITIGGLNRKLTVAYSTSSGNADKLDNKHADAFIQTNDQMIKGTYGVLPGYHQENGWHRIATINASDKGYGSFILYITGSWNWKRNTLAIIHIDTMHTTAKLTLVSGVVGFITKIRLVNVSANLYHVDVNVDYTDSSSSTSDTPGTAHFYFLGNGQITTNTTALKITETVTTTDEITLVDGGGAYNIHDAGNKNAITLKYSSGGFTSNPSYLAAWNGYQITYVAPSYVTVGSASNADTLDGVHANGLLTGLSSNETTNLSITVGGTTKTITDLHAHYLDTLGKKQESDLSTTYPKGLSSAGIYNSGFPFNYGSVITSYGNGGYVLLAGSWSGNITSTTDNNYATELYLRNRRDSYDIWSTWTRVITDKNYSSILDSRYYTETEVNNKLAGYLPLSGGTMTGNIKVYTDGDGRGLKFGTSVLNSLSNQLLWQSAEAIRFGSSSWDWNAWAGLKYNHSNKIIYLGLADGTIFNANSGLSGGKLYLPGISDVYIGNGTYKILHANNYNSYSPTLTGGGASGTWGISITGNAKTATTANQLALNGIANDTTYGTYAGIIQNAYSGPESESWHNSIKILHNNSGGYYTQLAQNFTGSHGLWHRSNRNGTISRWYKVIDDLGGIMYGDLSLQSDEGNSPKLRFIRGGSVGDSSALWDWLMYISSGHFYLQADLGNGSWTTELFINTSHLVGIGTTSPSHKLHVNGNVFLNNLLYFTDSAASVIKYGSHTTTALGSYPLPSLGSAGLGLYVRPSKGTDEGGIIITEDTCMIFNAGDSGWNFQVHNTDLKQKDFSGTDGKGELSRTFGVTENTHYAWSRGGFLKNGSDDNYVLLGGGGHKSISSFQTTYDSRYVIKTGDTMTGRLIISTTIKDHSLPTEQCLVINSTAIPEGTTLTLKNSPGIGFHIASRSWGSLVFNGTFNFINNDATSYLPVKASKFITNGGTSSLFVKGDGSLDSNTYLTSHLSLANYVTLNGNLTITGLKTFQSESSGTGVSLILKNNGWAGSMSTAMDFYNGKSYTVPNARIETKMVGSGNVGGTLIFYTQTKHASTNPNPNGLNERLRIDDNGLTKITGNLTVTGISNFSEGTVKLDVLNIPTSSGGTTFGPGTNGLILKSNGTTVYWASDNNSTYAVYGKTIDASYKTAYRTQTGRASGYYLAAIRCDTASVDEAPLYGTGMAFGMTDTHGYLYMSYSSANAYIGAGNADKLNWTATLLHSSNYSSFLDSRYVNVSGDTMTGNLAISNGGELRLKAHSSASTDPGDIVFQNSSGTEIGRIYKPAGVDAFYVRFSGSDTSKVLLHSENYTTYTDSKYVNVSGDTMTGNLTMSNSSLYFGSNGTGASTTGNETRLPSHIYRNVYDTSGNVYDHYYNTGYTAATNSLANLRVKSGSTFKTLSFGGNGTFTWNGNTVWHAGNDGSGSGLDADTVDGLHVSKAGNTKPWGTIVSIGTDGVSEMGKYIDFHFDNTTGSDYSTRLLCSSVNNIYLNLPSVSGTLALIHDIDLKLDAYVKKSGDWMSGTLYFNDNIGLFGQMAEGTDHWEIKGTGTSDNGRLKIQVHDNATTDAMDFEFVDWGGDVYRPLSMTGLGAEIIVKPTPGSWISGKTEASIKYQNLTAIDSNSFWKFYNMKSKSGHVVCYGGLGDTIGFYGYYAATTANRTDWNFTVNTSNGNWTASASLYAAHFYENSDEQLKTNIQEILNSDKMPIIKEFDWKEDNSHSYGLIAQELEEQGYSELVSIKDNGYKTVNYSAALSLIVGKLQVKIKELEKEIENLKNKN